ncbi:hypothetical protein L218DRAFT_1082301 [Marasmius fiardii PR-910]|nr:hypothetical protein L218DRAFT_1082301 [Marasmius fiardii PR-910]
MTGSRRANAYKGLVITAGDSVMNPDRRCTRCISFGMDCTHQRPVKVRGLKPSYYALLEGRVKSLESTLGTTENRLSTLLQSQSSSNSNSHPSIETVNDSAEENEDSSHVSLSDQMQKLSLHTMSRFFGSSSGFSHSHSVHGVRREVTGDDSHLLQSFKPSQFWQVPPWELETTRRERPSYTFPEHSLMVSLISIYFQKVNILFPILHAPTFWRNVVQGLHLENPYFGAVVLGVCALGARYSDDKRVLSSPDQPSSAGWKWFEQVPLLRRSKFDPPNLYELQYYVLGAIYSVGTSSPGTCWYLVGLGIRTAVDMGVHRRTPGTQRPNVESEQRKRAFWVLVTLDRIIGGLFLGRPFAIHEDDFDLELPIECDDEYWENVDPERAFKQPPDRPSYISSFIAFVKLCDILVIAVRKLFSVPKLQPRDQETEQQAVVEIDSALNDWKSRLPQHLRWDPARERGIFFARSGFLLLYYHAVQIQTHRRFVHKSSPLSFSSLAMCTNAAKSSIHIVSSLIASNTCAVEFIFFCGFNAGCLLFSNIWASRRAGIKVDVKKATADVEKLKNDYQSCQNRFVGAARYLDFLNSLSRGLEDCDPSTACTQHAAPIPSGITGRLDQQFDNSRHVETIQASPLGDDTGYQMTASEMARGYIQDPIFQTFGDETYGMQSYPQPVTAFEGFTGQQFQQAIGPTQALDPTNMRPMPQGFAPFGGWNNYATNMASLDLDMFMQSNPDMFI